jgi:integrase
VLTDLKCRKAKAEAKPVKLADSLGLYLYVTPTGFKSWRMKYRWANREKTLTFGAYPEVSLTEARERRDAARKLLRDGADPGLVKRKQRAERLVAADASLKAVALRWHKAQAPHWSPRYAKQVLGRFEKDIFPAIGGLPIGEVTVPLLLGVLQRVEARGSIEIAHKLRQHLSAIFLNAIGAGLATSNPAEQLGRALTPYVNGARPAVRSVAEAKALLAAIEKESAAPWKAAPATKLASRLLALTAARPGMVRLAAAPEFEGLDGPEPLWRVPAVKMKLTARRKRDLALEFVIPLSPEAAEVAKLAIATFGETLFPGVRGTGPISDSTLSKLYRSAGYTGTHVPHGWRATFSTVMNELAAIENRVGDRDIVDLMLAHLPRGVEAVYNRYAYLPRRRELACEWAQLLMEGAPPAASLLPR